MINIQKFFNYFFKLAWLSIVILLIFFDRNNFYMVLITLILLFVMSFVTVIRSLNSRNEWRKIIDDGDVEIKDKISF